MIGSDVPAGAYRAFQEMKSYPAIPPSAIVGMSGRLADREAPVTPIALSAPDFTNGRAVATAVKVMKTSPFMTSVTACAPLLYGTWTISTSAIELNKTAGR